MPNGDDQKKAILHEMASIVQRMETKVEAVDKRTAALEITHVEKDAFNATVNELRVYTDKKMEAGILRGEKALDDKIGLSRSGIMHDIEQLITERFDEWEKKSLIPLFEQLAADREEREQKEREMQWQRIKNRITTATSLIALLTAIVLFFLTFQGDGKPTDSRHLDRLNSVGDAALSLQ